MDDQWGKKKRKSWYVKEICEICQVLFFFFNFLKYGFEPAAEVCQAHESWMTFALSVSFKSWKNNFRKRLANAECTQPRLGSASSVLVYRSEELSIWENHALRNLITSYSQDFLCSQLFPCPCSQQAGWQHTQSSAQTRPGSFLAKRVCNSLFTLLKSLIPESWNPGTFKTGSKLPNDFTEARIIH